MKKYLRKITKILEEVIGTATVVSPELVINKRWNPSSDNTNNIMKVPSKNFYDYLGHYMCPDEALKDGEGNRGLGVGPYNNDLGFALDKRVFSSPAPISMEIIYSSEGITKPFKNIDSPSLDWNLKVETDDVVDNYDNRNTTDYAKSGGFVGYYDWQGEWGDIENGFETGVDIQINVSMYTDKVRGGVDGSLIPSGANMTIWIGDVGDVKKSSSYKGQTNTKLFYNQHFSTGFNSIGNGTNFNRTYFARINRKPFETRLIINGVGQARGGKYRFISLFARTSNPFKILNFGKLPIVNVDLNFGDRIWQIFQDIFSFLNDFFAMLLGNNGDFYGRVNAEADVVGTRIASIDRQEILKHPAYKYFQTPGSFTPISYHAFLFTQFYYPYFNQNPLFAYTDTFNYKKPFLENKVVTSRFFNNLTNSDSYISKKYTYFVPSLFCLLFETKIGVFYEQLAKQLKDDSGTNNQTNFNIKLEGHKTTTNPQNFKEKQDKCLYDIMFPTNEEHWNNYLETTGWADNSKADNTSFLSNFIQGSDIPANIITRSTFSDYEDVFTEYPFLPQNSISSIGDVIGDFQQIDGILKQDIGYDLNTWTALCNSNTTFKTLSSGEPKNLAFKIIEFILWYLEPNGIPDQTRLSVNSLLEFEKLLDEDVEDYTELNTDKNYRDYHIVGTKLYDRTCK